jgi:hypothetical protein
MLIAVVTALIMTVNAAVKNLPIFTAAMDITELS